MTTKHKHAKMLDGKGTGDNHDPRGSYQGQDVESEGQAPKGARGKHSGKGKLQAARERARMIRQGGGGGTANARQKARVNIEAKGPVQ